MTMDTQIKTANGVFRIPIDTAHLNKRRVFINGRIDMNAACDFADKIMLLNDESHEPIDLLICSVGGDVAAGMLMYDVIQTSPAPIRMYCRGYAYSMAAILFASGRHGRYILPNSEIMIHEPLINNGIRGNASSIKSISEDMMAVRTMLNTILANHTGKTIKQIEKASSFDNYFDSEASVKFGLADKVITFGDMMKGELG
jgi:ATP-dependent Clp protease protease subunit